ncbi:hypothetical protein ACQQ2N_17455 [Dokdonella sp. MW10]|uniref:hypothetical protein n=1 Tax=Dokdonella sp. MW10 TaxID=2992926 RepID=UPI003F7EE20E
MRLNRLDAKVLGFGKCGSRMCYDFFATSCGYPLSYELRMPGGNRLERVRRIVALRVRDYLNEMFGERVVPLNVTYGFFDSDHENEIAQSIAIAAQSKDATAFAFPGQRHELGDHGSGCDYGIVAEAISLRATLPSVIANDPATFRLWFSSLAGGTGSGSTLVFLAKDRSIARGGETHHLVVGVLPAEDTSTISGAAFVEAEKDHAINAGRFLVRWLAAPPKQRADGLLLISNSGTAFLNPNEHKDVFRPEALLNSFAARIFFHMAYANSADAQCHPDFDPVEMTNAFSGGLLIAGVGIQETEDGEDEAQQRRLARRLMKEALGNPELQEFHGDEQRVVGLSVPLREAELRPLLEAVESGGEVSTRPLEFRSAEKVVVLCALSSTRGHATRKQEILKVMGDVFANSDIKFHFMKSHARYDHLTVIIVKPFVRQVQRLIYGYLSHAWRTSGAKPAALGAALDAFLKDEQNTCLEALRPLLSDVEDTSATLLGDRSAELLAKYPPKLAERAELETALLSLRKMLQWERSRVPESTI